MRPAEGSVLDYVSTCRRPGHVILIDPDDQTPEVAAERCIAAVAAGSRMIFVGGSTGTDGRNVHETCIAIQEALELCAWNASQATLMEEEDWKVPVVLFPAAASALSPAADAITFMMLMNSTERAFLVGEQVKGAPLIRTAEIEPLSMGYLICAPGGRAGEVGRGELIEPNDIEAVTSYAMCASAYGFRLLYLEAGSGADYPVNTTLIEAAKAAAPDLVLLVGGGIRDGSAAQRAAAAGADWVVTGNLTESFDQASQLQEALTSLIEEMRTA